ncbi:MAG: hypothetical protein Q9191_004813, partial [Dirinaria sp. TL-2023a]
MESKTLVICALEGKTSLVGLFKSSSGDHRFNIDVPQDLYDQQGLFGEDLRWYIEDYARNDPFSTKRALSVGSKLRSHGSSLVAALCQSEDLVVGILDIDLLIEIDGRGDYSRQLSWIHWEILEDPSFWAPEFRPRRISVLRRVQAVENVDEKGLLLTLGDMSLNATPRDILAITARPSLGSDIPHRMITRSIFEAVQKSNNETATFKIVRPGTFQALQEELCKCEFGYYGLVHLDLHGFVQGGSVSYRAFLRFVHSNDENGGAEDIPVDEIAKLLSNRGVHLVVINACESASEQGSSSSIVRSIVESGVSMAVGMRYQISESAAEIFTQTFYRSLLSRNLSITEAMHTARLSMRIYQKRKTKFNTEVDVLDVITPILVSRVKHENQKVYEEDLTPPLPLQQSDSNLYGREKDILFLENALVNSNVLLLKGRAGTGKTHLMQHLSPWWKSTGFVKDSVIIDCSTMETFNAFNLQLAIVRAFAPTSSSEPTDVLAVLNQHPYLIVLDNLDIAKLEETKSKLYDSLRRFLRKIKRTFVVLLSRQDEEWAKAAARGTYQLQNLDMNSSLQLATNIIAEGPHKANLTNRMESRFLEQCISLIDGNPLAIKLLLRAYDPSRCSVQEFFTRLTDGEPLDEVQPGLLAAADERGWVDAQRLIKSYTWGEDPASFRDVDFRLLRPFWRSFPLDLGPYRWNFLRCKERVLSNNYDDPRVYRSQIKSSMEFMDANESSIYRSRGNIDESSLARLASMDESIQFCEGAGFMTKIVAEADSETHVRLHPLMALALKQREFIPPSWLRHVVEVAYHRFYSYRSRHWPSTGIATSAWDLPRAQLNFEFANFVTSNNYSLRLTPTLRAVSLMKPSISIAQALSGDARRLAVIFAFLERFLQTFGAPLAEHAPSTYSNAWASGVDHVGKVGQVPNDPLSDGRGMIEMFCILAITIAANLAHVLGLQRDYSPMLEGLATHIGPASDFADVNLPLLKTARLTLLRISIGTSRTHEATVEHLDYMRKLRDKWEQEDPSLRLSRVTRNDISKLYSRITHETIIKLDTANTPDEIQALENELLHQLDNLLDEEDCVQAKRAIYECLSVLAFKREDYSSALQHIDTTTDLAGNIENVSPEGMQKLALFREAILAASTADTIEE